MAFLIASCLFLFVGGAIALYGYHNYARQGRAYATLTGKIAEPATVYSGPVGQRPKVTVTLQWLGEKVPIAPQTASFTRRLLMAAGYRHDSALYIFFGLKVALAAGIFFPVFIVFLSRSHSTFGLLLTLASAGLGYALPSFVLDFLIRRYRQLLRFSLPDALDLMVVCVEAGLALDRAIAIVSRELAVTHKQISEELSLVSLEMRAGTRRADALSNLAKRTGEPELKKLVAVLIQSDRFGTSMADALRTHSEFMRVYRRQEAEERSNKIGVKIIFPIFFLILPAIMLVAVGPALLQLQKNLMPLMKEFKP